MAKYDAEAMFSQASEAIGGETVDFDWGGEEFSFPHPLMADDEWLAGLADVDGGAEGVARYLLGDEQYEKFLKVGGKPFALTVILNQVNKDATEVMADGTPTRPGISSVSSRKRSRRR